MLRNIVILSLCFILLSCSDKTIESIGGTILTFELGEQGLDQQKEIVKDITSRIANFSALPDAIVTEVVEKQVVVKVPGEYDTLSLRHLVEWDRMMKLSHSIETTSFPKVRAFLGEYIEVGNGDKPYKANSTIGYVSQRDQLVVDSMIKADSFLNAFPEVSRHFWGARKKKGKYALFLEKKNSAVIDETMYESVEAFELAEEPRGALSLMLNAENATALGPLTGNDSTYLLHTFHDEVYISKIIKPYIEGPAFSMSGAFSPSETETFAALWNSKDTKPSYRVVEIELIQK